VAVAVPVVVLAAPAEMRPVAASPRAVMAGASATAEAQRTSRLR
jgi:hypothetical protein